MLCVRGGVEAMGVWGTCTQQVVTPHAKTRPSLLESENPCKSALRSGQKGSRGKIMKALSALSNKVDFTLTPTEIL